MSACRSCGAEIFWAVTSRAKRIPVDAEPADDGNLSVAPGDPPTVYVVPPGQPTFGAEPLYRSHFATCPNADEHRRR